MGQETKSFRSSYDNTLQRESKRTKKSPLDELPLATRHEIFFRKVEDQNSPKSLPGDKSQKHGDITQQNKVAKEQREYQENSSTADESLPQTCVEHVSKVETSKREGSASTLESVEMPKRESSGGYWETVKSLSGNSLTQRAKETVGWAWQTLSDKSLTQRAKETVEWTWQNSVKALSWKNLRRAMVMYLAVSGPLIADGVKIYGRNGCSIDSHLIFDEHRPEYDSARRIMEAQFERIFPKLAKRYAKDPCDPQYEKIRVTFDPHLKVKGQEALGTVYVYKYGKHVFFQPTASEHTKWDTTLESTFLHELSHVVQDSILPPLKDYDGSAVQWVEEAHADYNRFIYGTEQDTKHMPVPPNFDQHGDLRMAGGFMLWLDKEFSGFVDNIIKISQKKQIEWKDIENLTGEPLGDLWEEYKKINFTAEMSQFLEEQKAKCLGSNQQRKRKAKKDEL